MILGLIFLGVAVALFVQAVRDRYDWGLWVGTGLCVLIPILAVAIGVWACNRVQIKQMRIFRDINKPNIERIVGKTLGYLDELNTTQWGLEKMELYRAASERLVLLTENVNDYNKQLAGYRYYKSSPLFNWFVPRLDDLEYIEIGFK